MLPTCSGVLSLSARVWVVSADNFNTTLQHSLGRQDINGCGHEDEEGFNPILAVPRGPGCHCLQSPLPESALSSWYRSLARLPVGPRHSRREVRGQDAAGRPPPAQPPPRPRPPRHRGGVQHYRGQTGVCQVGPHQSSSI